ncbi:hypothetical protein, partial [Hydrogenophaga sp.]|uniref:hypothetical protein n=1 Tax=Hydrogenophaga sp. TaxID=1904254 RepID=UPI003AF5A2F9
WPGNAVKPRGFPASATHWAADRSNRLLVQRSLKYVVDCGSMTMYASARDREISKVISQWGIWTKVDFLFVSHAHADHVNGLRKLFDPTSGLRVETVFMPLLSVEERLFAFARTSVEDPLAASDDFYREFTADPIAALTQLEPTRIVLVRRGTQEGNAPFANPDTDGDSPTGAQILMGEQQDWKPVGSGVIGEHRPADGERVSPATDQTKNNARPIYQVNVLEMPDTVGLLVTDKNSIQWLFSPYIDPLVKTKEREFLEKLAALLFLSVEDLATEAAKSNFRLELLTKHESVLRQAYMDVEKDLNLTSMCLYSGPARPPTSSDGVFVRSFQAGSYFEGPHAKRCGWLGTGDADLKTQSRRKSFFKHFGALLENVQTLTLPHHGSEHNFHRELLDKIRPKFCVAAADKVGKWRHPGSGVVQAVASFGAFVSVVTSGTKSLVEDEVYLW